MIFFLVTNAASTYQAVFSVSLSSLVPCLSFSAHMIMEPMKHIKDDNPNFNHSLNTKKSLLQIIMVITGFSYPTFFVSPKQPKMMLISLSLELFVFSYVQVIRSVAALHSKYRTM